jgi:hypothetical protein
LVIEATLVNNRDNGPNPRNTTLHCATVCTPDSQEAQCGTKN